jgi:polysaccharide biosynthesis transport protein
MTPRLLLMECWIGPSAQTTTAKSSLIIRETLSLALDSDLFTSNTSLARLGDSAVGLQLARVLAVWRRRKWLGILPFAAVLCATATITVFLPNTYKASATVLVVDQQVPVDFVRSTVTGALDTRLQAISQDILSRSRLEELINNFGLYATSRRGLSRDELVEQVRRDIEVKPKGLDRAGGTIAFTISYQGADPETVAPVTNALASYYVEANTKARERQAHGTAQFLKVQLEEVRARLAVQERRVSEFKQRHLGELPQQMEANLATLERLNAQFRVNSDRQLRTTEQRQELVRRLESMEPVVATPGHVVTNVQTSVAPPDPTTVRLEKLRQDLADLRMRFSDKYPDVMHLKAEVARLERQVFEAKRDDTPTKSVLAEKLPAPSIANPHAVQTREALSQVDVEITALKEEEKYLRTAMATYQARVENIPRRDLEFQALSRDYDSTKELYRTLLKRYDEAELAESLEQRQKGEQFRILEQAIPPSAPIAPNRGRLMLVNLLLSLGVGVGLVVLREQLDTSFHTIDDLRAFTSLPALGSIRRIVTASDIRRSRRRVQLAAGGAVLGLTLVVGAAYFVASGNEQLLRLLTRSLKI